MKSTSRLSALGACVLFVAQACGSDDGKQTTPNKVPPTAQGGDGAAGETTGGGAPSGGSAGKAGSGGTAGTIATAGEGTGGGIAGEAAGGSAGEPVVGGAGGASGGGGEAGALGEGGVGGASESVTCEVAPTCSGTLADLGTGDFSITFTLTTTAAVRSGVISQRSACMHSKFWDIRLGKTGNASSFSIEFDDGGSNYTSFVAPTSTSMTDGTPHDVRVCRKAGQIYAFADGALIGSVANKTPFTTLPALTTLTTKCTAYDGTIALVGTVTDACVGAL